jgi:hypothetical protein
MQSNESEKHTSDLFKEVDDWFENKRVAYNPHSILVDKADFDHEWRRLFSVPYVDQGSTFWKTMKNEFISGSEVGSALNENRYDPYLNYVLWKAGRLIKIETEESAKALSHGKFEDLAGLRWTFEKKDISFKFGLIPHSDPNYKFIAVSPDLVALNSNCLGEIKCPYKRPIIPLNVDSVEYSGFLWKTEVECLVREVLIQGDQHNYIAITNLPIEVTNLLDKMVYYWHQIQLQHAVIPIGDTADFVQL